MRSQGTARCSCSKHYQLKELHQVELACTCMLLAVARRKAASEEILLGWRHHASRGMPGWGAQRAARHSQGGLLDIRPTASRKALRCLTMRTTLTLRAKTGCPENHDADENSDSDNEQGTLTIMASMLMALSMRERTDHDHAHHPEHDFSGGDGWGGRSNRRKQEEEIEVATNSCHAWVSL